MIKYMSKIALFLGLIFLFLALLSTVFLSDYFYSIGVSLTLFFLLFLANRTSNSKTMGFVLLVLGSILAVIILLLLLSFFSNPVGYFTLLGVLSLTSFFCFYAGNKKIKSQSVN